MIAFYLKKKLKDKLNKKTKHINRFKECVFLFQWINLMVLRWIGDSRGGAGKIHDEPVMSLKCSEPIGDISKDKKIQLEEVPVGKIIWVNNWLVLVLNYIAYWIFKKELYVHNLCKNINM